jgi:DNA-binding IclR family transcriptional regulator
MVVIARVESPNELGLDVRIGHRRPLLEATSGLVIVAFQPEEVRARWLKEYTAANRRQNRADLLETLAKIGEQGYAAIPSTAVSGVIDISTPVLQGSGAVAALAVPYMSLAAVRTSRETVIKLLRATASEISSRLG